MTNITTNTLTVEKGIEIQREHLSEWKTVLKEEVYNELVKYCDESNKTSVTGYDVKRGSDLSTWIRNYSIYLRYGKK